MWSVGCWGSPRTSQRSTGQNHFHGNTNPPFAIFPVLSLAQTSKSNSGSCLSTNLGSSTNNYGCVLFTPCTRRKKEKKSQFYSGIPDELPDSLIFLNPHPSAWAPSMFSVVKWALWSTSAPTDRDRLGEKHVHSCVLPAQLATSPCNAIFIWKNSWPTMVVQTLVSGRNFLEKEQSEPLTSQKTIDSIYWRW